MIFAPFALELKSQFFSGHGGVAVTQGGQTKGTIMARILFISHTNQCRLQELDQSGQHLPLGQVRKPHVFPNLFSDERQPLRKLAQAGIFGFIADRPPASMIAILLAPPCVAPRRLQMSVGILANPDFLPSRRDDQSLDAPDFLLVLKQPPIACDVTESLAATLTP